MSSALANIRVAIVGSGPSGFYAAESLQKGGAGVRIDMYDRLPTPFGLVRGGVAPDHPKIKSVTRIFDRIAADPGFRFRGHVRVGQDVSVAELRENYDVVIIAIGAPTDRHLNIPGEALLGSHPATDLVGWYNGHPDFTTLPFDLSQREVAVVGIGNVAMDVTRILLTPPEELATTDIAPHALHALRDARIATIHILARRGPVQAACTTPELRELGDIPGVTPVVRGQDLNLDAASMRHLQEDDDRTALKNLEIFRQFSERVPTEGSKRIVFHFNVSPTAILGESENDPSRVTGIRLMRNKLQPDTHGTLKAIPTGEALELPVGLVFRSVGYRGVALPELPFDPVLGVIPNMSGRVTEAPGSATTVRGLYTCGWIKRGPTGIIGTNKSCAAETVEHIFADAGMERIPRVLGSPEAVDALLAARDVTVTDWQHWLRIDAAERAQGAAIGAPRVKLVNLSDMLTVGTE